MSNVRVVREALVWFGAGIISSVAGLAGLSGAIWVVLVEAAPLAGAFVILVLAFGLVAVSTRRSTMLARVWAAAAWFVLVGAALDLFLVAGADIELLIWGWAIFGGLLAMILYLVGNGAARSSFRMPVLSQLRR